MSDKTNISSGKKKFIVCIFLTIATLAVYGQVTQHDFINIDDTVYVTENSHIHLGITPEGMQWAFSTLYGDFWHPLTWLSLMLDYQLYGLNAAGYHITNLILHLMSTLLLFLLFTRMTQEIWKSAFVAALFALHPFHVESVAWIAERKDVLSVFFCMLTLYCYVHYTEKPDTKRYLVVLFSFVLALMSKPMVVTLPIIMMILDYWPLRRFEYKESKLFLWQLKEKLPFFILSVIFSIITFHAHYDPSEKVIPLWIRLTNAPFSFVSYLGKTLWPQDLAFFYPFSDQIPVWQVLGATVLILSISILVILIIKRLPFLFVGWLWYAITILPIIGIIEVNTQAMADRYIYLPSIGISIMLAWGIPLLFQREYLRKKILFPTAIVFLAILATLAWKQCSYWKNSIALLNHTLRIKDVYTMHDCLGRALSAEGKIEESINHYNQAIRLKPDYANAYFNRAIAHANLGQKERAIEDYNQVIRLKHDYALAYYNRGFVYHASGQYQNSVKDFSETLRLRPDYIPAYFNRAMVYSSIGQHTLALEDYSEIIRLQPDDGVAYNNRGSVYLNLGNHELGCRDAQKACELGMCRVLEIAKGKGDCH